MCNIKDDQQFDLLCLQLEGRAHWYIDSLKPVPKDLAELKAALKANPDYKRLKQVPNLIISLDTEVSTPLQLSNTPQSPINDLIGY